mmetsp:Transcript_146305/g.207480  ORF Transcript_146305/g.207480 Transcript_146305/m.207480 type:complete len:213 (-) Transcript_146305:129-767(-)
MLEQLWPPCFTGALRLAQARSPCSSSEPLAKARLSSEPPVTPVKEYLSSEQAKPDRPDIQQRAPEARHEPSATTFQPRSEEEVRHSVDEWMPHLHSRGRIFFQDEEKLRSILETVARSTDRTSDPILQHKCSLWHGDVKAARDTKHAAIKLMGPGEEGAPCVTYVNRVLIFLFSGDDKLERWMRLPKQPLKMRCENQLCVALGCIAEECDPT